MRAQAAASVIESEMRKTPPDKVPFEIEVHCLIDDPIVDWRASDVAVKRTGQRGLAQAVQPSLKNPKSHPAFHAARSRGVCSACATSPEGNPSGYQTSQVLKPPDRLQASKPCCCRMRTA